ARSRMDWMTTDANASLISIRSRSPTLSPALPSAWLMAAEGCDCSQLPGPATLPCAPISARTGAPDDAAAGSVRDLRGGPRRDRAVLGECGPQPAHRLHRDFAANALISVEDHRLTAPLWDRDGGDLRGQQPVLDGGGGPLVGSGRELVLLAAAYAQTGVVGVGQLAHRQPVERVGQAV